jgi:catechol 2,3-dioxygenase-like lactoylglutathione lyase family enzyme
MIPPIRSLFGLIMGYKFITMIKPTLIPELKVTHFKISLDFYTRLLGFAILYDRPEDDFAMLGINGAQLMIEGFSDVNRSWKVGAMDKPFGRGINIQIEIPNIESLYNRLKAAGYPIYQEVEEKWYRINDNETGNRQFLVQDPDGYLLRFFEDME